MTFPNLPRRRRALFFGLSVVFALATGVQADQPKVPEGFEVRLVATVPAVLYPCQLATAPDGGLFVAEDPMDQVGPYESKNGRILLFRDGKDPIVFADGFRAIFGMAWRDGSLYVCHMPFLTVLKDTDGDGKADERKEIFKDLGPTNNAGLNDHIVSGLQFGVDGRLYISVGDKGVPKVTGPDGRTAQIIGGGTLRCRPDGTGIEVYSTGTRNHLEPNLDEKDNLFTYDNTDDGDGWWTRVTHHVDGGYYGYPYDYHDHPGRFLNRMAEYGGGSPCGALVYKEDAWPEKYRGMAFWAEWGKGKVQAFRFKPKGASFEVAEQIDFAVPDGLKDFRPIDLALSYDGKTLYVADWGMGGWGSKTEKVGRVFAITYKDKIETRPRGSDADSIEDQIKELDHPSFNERMRAQRALIARKAFWPVVEAMKDKSRSPIARRHLLWTMYSIGFDAPAGEFTDVVANAITAITHDPEPDIRAQAARALGMMTGRPIGGLTELLDDPDPTVRLQAVIALGRIKDPTTIPEIIHRLADSDPYVAFSARQALRRIDHWGPIPDVGINQHSKLGPAAEIGLKSKDAVIRKAMLATLERVYNLDALQALARFSDEQDHPAEERALALNYLAATRYKLRPWDGKWWGTRPSRNATIPLRDVDWEGAGPITAAFRGGLSDADVVVRLAGVAGIRAIEDKTALPHLRSCFGDESEPEVRIAIISALGALKDQDALPMLAEILREPKSAEPLREASLAAVESIGGEKSIKTMIDVLGRYEPADEGQIRVLAALGRLKARPAVEPIKARLSAPAPAIRAAAATALGQIGQAKGAVESLRPLVADPSVPVRKAALVALTSLKDKESFPIFMKAAENDDTRFEATMALAAFPDIKALQPYLRGLTEKSPDLRKACVTALTAIRDQAAPILESLSARHELSPSTIPELGKVYTAVAPIMTWHVMGPMPIDSEPPQRPADKLNPDAKLDMPKGEPLTWKALKAIDAEGQVNLAKALSDADDLCAFASAEIESAQARDAQMVVGSDDTLSVWVNGKRVYHFADRRGYDAETARFEVNLKKGSNRIFVKCGNRGGPWSFSVGVTTAGDHAFLKAPAPGAYNPDVFRSFALKTPGKPEHGRVLFADLKGLACIKCHAVKGEGGNVGPDMTGIGVRYPREELIQSILYPSARIFSGYEPIVLALSDGRLLTGLLKSDSGDSVEIQDADGKVVRVPKADIEARKTSDVSLMPNGLVEGLKKEDFADLVAYLESLKEAAAKPEGK